MAQAVRVQRPEQWAVLDCRGVPIGDVSAYLRYLTAIERSPNTVRAYAYDLAHFFSFAESADLRWTTVTNETLALFIRHMRAPTPALRRPSNPAGLRSAASVNRALASVTSYALFLHESTNDSVYSRLLRTARRTPKRHEERYGSAVTVGPRLRAPRSQPVALSLAQTTKIIDSCGNLRDKFLFSLLNETGMRIGQALLLRHSDIRVPECYIRLGRRDSEDEETAERNKSRNASEIPVPADLIRLYASYVHSEFGMTDSDYVFVNLWSGDVGRPLSYKTVEQTVGRLRRQVGFGDWSAHSFRHTYVTRLLSKGVSMETVSYLVTHSSVATTIDTYSHLGVEDVRAQLLAAGVWAR